MKYFLLAAALTTTTAALAQAKAPGPVPGPQPVVTPDMRDGGSPRAHRRHDHVPGLSHHDQKQLRRQAKVKPDAHPSQQPRP